MSNDFLKFGFVHLKKYEFKLYHFGEEKTRKALLASL